MLITIPRYTLAMHGVFFVESLLAALVYLITDTKVTSHTHVLNQFRSLIITPQKNSLFSPIDFSYRKINGEWQHNNNSTTDFLREMCPTLIKSACDLKNGDWVTYFHLLHGMSDIYRYRSTLPFLMTNSKNKRLYGKYIIDINLIIKLWLEILIAEIYGKREMGDLLKMTKHRLLKYHKINTQNFDIRWELMEKKKLIFFKKGLSSESHRIFTNLKNELICTNKT